MEIRAKCRLDKESIKELSHVSVYKKSDPKKTMIVRIILDVFIILLCLAEIIAFGVDLTPILLMIIAVILIFIECFYYFWLPIIRYNSMANMKDAENEYVFYDDVLKVFTAGKEYNGEAEITYSLLVKVYETSRYFFLYQTNNQVLIVDKLTVEDDGKSHIRELLAGTINGKYIICKH